MVLRRSRFALIAAGLALTVAPALAATTKTGDRCPEGRLRGIDLGIGQIDGSFSKTVKSSTTREAGSKQQVVWFFRSEPRIADVTIDGPAAGRLKSGDVLIAVDGQLITTRAASARLSELRPGQPIQLLVRRSGKSVPVLIIPREACLDRGSEPFGVTGFTYPLGAEAPEAPLPPDAPSWIDMPAPTPEPAEAPSARSRVWPA
ncbi:MAG: PDZ domain-containing protein, partial [Candidatus Eisenbacteria bacterium]|nr:PDZ domain-containing protein [Candidatus Eisenbacteria bacterium]